MIDFNKILDYTGLTESELSKQLFPDLQTYTYALRAVANGERELKYSELKRLEAIVGAPLQRFEKDPIEWKGVVTEQGLAFRKGKHIATYSPHTSTLQLFLNGYVDYPTDKTEARPEPITYAVPAFTKISDLVAKLNELTADQDDCDAE